MAALWQSVDIKGEAAANAATELCRPMASITMTAMSRRFMGLKIPRATCKSKQSKWIDF
jgi:hypothetical protein